MAEVVFWYKKSLNISVPVILGYYLLLTLNSV